MPATLLIGSLSLIIFGFECTTIGFDVSRFLAVIADSIIPRLAPTSCVVRPSRRTFASTVQSVGRTLYNIGVTGFIICKGFPSSYLVKIVLVNSKYLIAAVDALHIVVTKVSQEGGRLLNDDQHCSQFFFDYRPLSQKM